MNTKFLSIIFAALSYIPSHLFAGDMPVVAAPAQATVMTNVEQEPQLIHTTYTDRFKRALRVTAGEIFFPTAWALIIIHATAYPAGVPADGKVKFDVHTAIICRTNYPTIRACLTKALTNVGPACKNLWAGVSSGYRESLDGQDHQKAREQFRVAQEQAPVRRAEVRLLQGEVATLKTQVAQMRSLLTAHQLTHRRTLSCPGLIE